MEITLIIYLLFVHWLADFVWQTDYIAKNKSKSNKVLLLHCGIYSLFFAIGTLNIIYGLLLGLIHFPVDYFTSRLNSKLYQAGKNHEFFVSLGFDQWIHFVTILLLGKVLL